MEHLYQPPIVRVLGLTFGGSTDFDMFHPFYYASIIPNNKYPPAPMLAAAAA